MSNSLRNSSIFPISDIYGFKSNNLQKDCTLQKTIEKFSKINNTEKQELTAKKKRALKDYYLKDTVRK
jgi:hypothetical protein